MPKKTNGLKVTILEGKTSSGKTDYFFSSKQDYIVLGCDSDICDVVFSQDSNNGIGSEHLGLRRSLGRYQLDLNTDYYVAVDGVAAYEEQEMSGTVELSLGHSVRIQITVIDHRKQAQNDKSIAQAHVHPAETSRTNRKAVFGLAAVLITALFMAWFIIDDNNKNLESVVGNLDAINLKDDRISIAVIKQIKKSVYVVLKQNDVGGESLLGTAWVTDNNQLATNAHVAIAFNTLKSAEKLLIRSSIAPYQSHQVTSVNIHPAYDLFKKMWKEYLPVQKGLILFEVMNTISPADVALMKVTDPDKLNGPLQLATASQLASLQVGTPVAFIGYPAENLLPGTLKQPVPVAQQDELVRLTDFFMKDREDGKNRLIQHGLPLIGGASGSPMFTEDGAVIGIISAVNATPLGGGRIANPADINFAQRIDFLQDLTKHNETEIIVSYVKQWQQDLTKFKRGVDSSLNAVNANLLSVLSPAMLADEIQLTGSIKDIQPKLKLVGDIREISLPYAGLHLLTVSSSSYRFAIKAKQNKKDFPVYTYPIPYSNLVNYQILVTDQAEELSLEIASAIKKNLDDPIAYKLDIKSWPLDPVSTIEQLAIHNAKVRISTKLSPQLIKKQSITIDILTGDSEIKYYYQTLPIDFEQPGYYLILTRHPQGNRLITALKDDKEVITRGQLTPQIGTLFYHHQNPSGQYDYMIYNKTSLKDVEIWVYFWSDAS